MIITETLSIAFASLRPFNDGPVDQPFPENDPANMAYVLGMDYFSFLSLNKLSDLTLQATLASYQLVIIALDLSVLDLVLRISQACNGRFALYSEGSIADYQRLSPIDQARFVDLVRQAQANFIYWEKYLPFYQSLTAKPVAYLPYPYLEEMVAPFCVPVSKRPLRVSIPSGLVGDTRNGLSSLLVANQLVKMGSIEQIDCWLAPSTFDQDMAAVKHLLLNTPFESSTSRSRGINWRHWLLNSRIDHRPLLNLRNKIRKRPLSASTEPLQTNEHIAFFRRQNWLSYLDRLGQSQLVIDLNNRRTVGRNSLDCTALGIPCISTNHSDLQTKLFPATTIEDCWNIPEAIKLANQLINDQSFYTEVVTQAQNFLKAFSPNAFTIRFYAILHQYPNLIGYSSWKQ